MSVTPPGLQGFALLNVQRMEGAYNKDLGHLRVCIVPKKRLSRLHVLVL